MGEASLVEATAPTAQRAPATCVVRTTGLKKYFGPVHALDGLDLCIVEGETFGLLGPNGSGKTTLIRALIGLLKPTGGEITVLGEKVPGNVDRVLPSTGYMPQLQALYTDLSVWENAQFYARVFGLSKKQERDRRVSEVIELVELTSRKDSLVSMISGGMRQRLSLACALVHKPRLLLLDEPTVGVDPELRATFWTYFRSLNADGVTIVLSSHVMDEADRCDRLGLIRAGRLLATGTPEEIRSLAGVNDLEQAFLSLAGKVAENWEEAK